MFIMHVLVIRCVTKSLSPDYYARCELFKEFYFILFFFFTNEFFFYMKWKIFSFLFIQIGEQKDGDRDQFFTREFAFAL